MIRIKRGVTKRARHKKWLDRASGFWGRAGTCYRIARERVERGLQHAFTHRKQFKRNIRRLWITRINAAVRESGINYSRFMQGVHSLGIDLNRKMLSELSITAQQSFDALVQEVISHLKSFNNESIKISACV